MGISRNQGKPTSKGSVTGGSTDRIGKTGSINRDSGGTASSTSGGQYPFMPGDKGKEGKGGQVGGSTNEGKIPFMPAKPK